MVRAKNKWTSGWTGLGLLLLCFFLMFAIYPLLLVLYKSVFRSDGMVTAEYFQKFFTKKYYWSTLVNSIQVTVVSTLISVLIGLPMAYVLRSVSIRGVQLVNILIVISYLSPPFIGAYAWIQLMGRNGFLTRILNAALGVKLGGIYGFGGIVLVFSLQSFPLVYMYVSGALQNMDHSLVEAAESLGCSAWQRMRRIITPLLTPTLLASALLVFMRVFADFGTPMLIGEGYRTFPVLIYSQFMGEVSTDDHFAASLCMIIIIITMALFFLQQVLAKKWSFSMSALRPMKPQKKTGISNALAYAFVYLVTLVAVLPQLTVIVTSFLETAGGTVYTGNLTLENYSNTLLAKDNNAIWNTYLFGIMAIALAVVIGVFVAFLSRRKTSAITSTLDTVSMLPYIIPGSVLGISFLYAFNQPPLVLAGTSAIMVIALCIRRMPYTIRSSSAIISQISPSIDEAAVSLGASERNSFLRVTLPMMLPGIISGAVMSWVTIISELSSSIILYTSRTRTLTVAIYAEVIRSNFGNAAAYATVLTLTSIVSLLLFFKLTGRRDISV